MFKIIKSNYYLIQTSVGINHVPQHHISASFKDIPG